MIVMREGESKIYLQGPHSEQAFKPVSKMQIECLVPWFARAGTRLIGQSSGLPHHPCATSAGRCPVGSSQADFWQRTELGILSEKGRMQG